MTTPKESGWREEFREYFDKTLKPKKPTIKNLDRELLVDFISKIEATAIAATEARVLEGIERLPVYMHGTPKENGSIDMRQTVDLVAVRALFSSKTP